MIHFTFENILLSCIQHIVLVYNSLRHGLDIPRNHPLKLVYEKNQNKESEFVSAANCQKHKILNA